MFERDNDSHRARVADTVKAESPQQPRFEGNLERGFSFALRVHESFPWRNPGCEDRLRAIEGQNPDRKVGKELPNGEAWQGSQGQGPQARPEVISES
jgi:hypothetical protein